MKFFALCVCVLSFATCFAGERDKGCWIGSSASGASPQIFLVPFASGGMLLDDELSSFDGSFYIYKRPGRTKYSNIVLRTFPGSGDSLEAFAGTCLDGKVAPIDGGFLSPPSKKGLNAVNVKLARCAFFGAMPSFVEFPELDLASANDASITLSLAPADVRADTVSLADVGIKFRPPLRTYTPGHFQLLVDNSPIAVFHVDPVRIDFGADAAGNVFANAGNLVIRSDTLASAPLRSWRQSVVNGKVERKSMSIIFLNDSGVESSRLNLFDCWPMGMDDFSLSSITGEVTTRISIGSASYAHP
jgi:hypothetical protein